MRANITKLTLHRRRATRGERNPEHHQSEIPRIVLRLAHIVLVGAALFFTATLSAFIYLRDRYFHSADQIFLFYVLPAVAVFFFLFCLRLASRTKVTVAALALCVGCAAYFGELVLTIRALRGSQEFAAASGEGVDPRSRRELIRDLREEGVDLYPPIFPSTLLEEEHSAVSHSPITIGGVETLPLSGISNRMTILCNETGQYVLFQSDEHGFNNPAGLWGMPQVEIAVVGDSFAQGMCVPLDENFTSQIRQVHPATLNLGVMGNGPLSMLATIREYLPDLRPRVVLWFHYSENDLLNLQAERTSSLLMRYLDAEFQQGLRSKQQEIDRSLTAYVRNLDLQDRGTSPASADPVDFATLFQLRNIFGLAGLQFVSDKDWSLFIRVLTEALSTVESWGGQLYFVYLPGPAHYYRTVEVMGSINENHSRVVGLVKELNIPIVDTDTAFRVQEDPKAMFNGLGKHYNVDGHTLVAREVMRSLNDHAFRQTN